MWEEEAGVMRNAMTTRAPGGAKNKEFLHNVSCQCYFDILNWELKLLRFFMTFANVAMLL